MGLRALAILVAFGSTLAGCLAPGAVVSTDTPLPDLPLLRPWLDNWHARASNFTLQYDPEARAAAAQGELVIANDLGVDRPWVWIGLERLTVTKLTDATGADLEYSWEPLGGLLDFLPEKAQPFLAPFGVLNVTLEGDVGHGATRTLLIAYEGWVDEDSPVFGPGVDAPFGAPNEATENLHFGLLPILASNPESEIRLRLQSPSSWTTLASAGLVAWEDDGTTVTADYAVKSPYVAITSLKGLESIEEDVGGVNVRTYFFPDMRAQGRVVHDVTRRVLLDMPKYTGAYPYDHIWTVPNGVVANAFSTPGLTFMGLNFYRFHVPNAPYQFGRLTPYVAGKDGFEMVVVHEHVHNWWGHNIEGNMSTREIRTSWLTEGITTFLSETVWFRDQYGESDAAASSNGKVADQIVNKLTDPEQKERGAARAGGDGYEKTCVALRALEAYGFATERPEAVFEALKLIQARYGLVQGGASAVTEEQAFAIFEEAFGEDLDWHWEAYFTGEKVPDLAVAGVARDGSNLTISVSGNGITVGAMAKAVTVTGREMYGIGVALNGTGDIAIVVPASAGAEPIVRVELDPLQYVYEENEANNVWIGRA